jgi:multidrug efflux pump subunit AcrB
VTHVEIPKAVLREYGLTLPDVADLIASSSNDVAAGAVRTSGGETPAACRGEEAVGRAVRSDRGGRG